MKRSTLQKRSRIANDVMFYIYTHIDTDINLDTLCEELGVDRFYMHRAFKEIFSRNIYEAVLAIRLQKASNLLLTNRYSTITEIANACGYSSQTSFIRAFKKRFGMTPKEWRKGGYKNYSDTIVKEFRNDSAKKGFSISSPVIVKMSDTRAYYIRHKGYTPDIEQTWQKLQAWSYTNDIQEFRQIALFHDNPTITPLQECQYVACIACDLSQEQNSKQQLPKFTISGGVYAKFHVSGKAEDFLPFMQWVYHEWLPQSEYETTTKPPFAVYERNEYLDKERRFSLDFYLSVIY